jgi:GNAT superfamily N-acetyltransferase/mannose-6-phosphate isomerase-like protein (cupin superfamily)
VLVRDFADEDVAQGMHGPARDGTDWRRTVLADDEGSVVGRGTLVRSPVHRDSCFAEVFVDPAARRRGIGRAIFSALLDRAPERHLLLGRAMSSHPCRLPFAEALGFSVLMRCPSPQVDTTSSALARWIWQHPAPPGISVMSASERPFDEVLDAWTDHYLWVHERWSPTYSRDTVRSFFAASGLAEVDFELSVVAVREGEIVAVACVMPHQWENRSFLVTETVRREVRAGTAIVGAAAGAALRACAARSISFVEFEGHEVDPHYYPLSKTLPTIGADPLLLMQHPGVGRSDGRPAGEQLWSSPVG